MGVSGGDATLEDGDWFGVPVVEAARLCALAAPGRALVSALAKAKSKGQSITCISNLKQLQYAWLMYVLDNNDLMPPNVNRNVNTPNAQAMPGSWVVGNAQFGIVSTQLNLPRLIQFSMRLNY